MNPYVVQMRTGHVQQQAASTATVVMPTNYVPASGAPVSPQCDCRIPEDAGQAVKMVRRRGFEEACAVVTLGR